MILMYMVCCNCTLSSSTRHPFSASPGLDDRDAAFMERLKDLAQEALTWPHLGEKQRLVWAAALELEAVPCPFRSCGAIRMYVQFAHCT